MNHVDNDMLMFACHLNVLINHNCYNSENLFVVVESQHQLEGTKSKEQYNSIVIPIIIIIIDNYYKNMVIDYAVCNTNNIFSM